MKTEHVCPDCGNSLQWVGSMQDGGLACAFCMAPDEIDLLDLCDDDESWVIEAAKNINEVKK